MRRVAGLYRDVSGQEFLRSVREILRHGFRFFSFGFRFCPLATSVALCEGLTYEGTSLGTPHCKLLVGKWLVPAIIEGSSSATSKP